MAANPSDASQVDLTSRQHPRSTAATSAHTTHPETGNRRHSLRRRLLSDGSWAFGAKLVTTLATLVTNVLLARLLTPAEFGTYILAISIVSFGAATGTLGLNQVVVRFVAESLAKRDAPRARRVIVISLRLGVLGTLGLSAAYLLLNPYLNQHLFSSPLLVSLAGLIAAWAALTVLQRLIGESFRGLHDIRYASIFRGWKEGMLSSVLTVAGLAVLWFYAGRTGLATVLWITVAAGISSSLLGILLLNSKLRGLKATDTDETPSGDLTSRDLLHVAWPLLINNLTLFLLTQSDIWILAALRPQEDIAVYGTAARLAGLVTIPLFVINAVVPPLIADLYIRREQQKLQQILRTITTTAGLPALVALVLLAFFGGPVLGLLFGDFFRQGPRSWPSSAWGSSPTSTRAPAAWCSS
ncbi:MAG: oligosaccharide flippase family protein [Trueperaceae bacterium]|nr:MAG: oligosaccharide flippase family protein [Trueperaceae bacterium]